MKSISSKLILLFIITALIPLAAFHAFSVYQLKKGTQASVTEGNLRLARMAAMNIGNYLENANRVLKNLSSEFSEAELDAAARDRLIKNAYMDFKFFQCIRAAGLDGRILASSYLTDPEASIPLDQVLPAISKERIYVSPVYIATSPPPVRPALRVAYPVYRRGALAEILSAEINLIYMWNLVQKIKTGPGSSVTVIDPQGNAVASSDLALLFELKPLPDYDRIRPEIEPVKQASFVYRKRGREPHLLASASLDGLMDGHVLIEQPTREAFGLARRLTLQVVAAAAIVVLLMAAVGILGVRWEILRHLKVLTEGIRRIGSGDWHHRVQIDSKDEFRLLGDTINQMAGQLDEQAGQIRRQERLSLIGRISGGLVHDLKHPIQNIRNWIRLLSTHYADEKYRKDFEQVVQREFENVDVFFKNLKDLTGDMSMELIPLPVEPLLREVHERFQLEAQGKGISLERKAEPAGLEMKADRFAMTRVLSNLVTNAIQATPKGGRVFLGARKDGNQVVLTVEDTGLGIPADRIGTIFDDFTTTKRKGLGLGLALSRKIVERHEGRIRVSSQPGKGTRFEILLPA